MERQQALARPLSRGREQIGRAGNVRFTLGGGVSVAVPRSLRANREDTNRSNDKRDLTEKLGT